MSCARVFRILALCIACLVTGAFGQTREFNIPGGELKVALDAYAKQSGVQLIYRVEDVNGVRSKGASGTLSNEEALARVLEGTGFASHRDSSGAIAVVPAASKPAATRPGSAEVMELITVTAQKRSELLLEVPVPVTSIRTDTLVDSNQLRLQDYYTRIPGLSMAPADLRGGPQLAIRGVTTGTGNPTVGITVDDVPYGASTQSGGGYVMPDFDPGDLARIEELRGPQGTLYGASSMGGLLKFVTVDPSTDGVSGRVQGGLSNVHNGADLGYNVRGSLNVPLSDTLAVRVSGYTRLDPGYIDNVQTGDRGVNRAEANGGRFSALWRPSEDLSLKLGALIQHSKADGSPYVDVQRGLGDLQQSALRGTGGYNKTFEVYSGILTAKLWGADLTAVSGYSVNRISDVLDLTPALASATQSLFGVTGTANHESNKTSKFAQEVRLSAPIGQRFEWLLGAFYTHENSNSLTNVIAHDPATGAGVGSLFDGNAPVTFTEYAAFADVTFHVSDRFDVQIGGRESRNRQSASSTATGPFAGPPSVGSSKDSAFTYLVTPRFKVSSDLMVYARLASGYRPGGFNSRVIAGTPSDFPTSYRPDKTSNYEIGVKGHVLDHALSFDASLYYIDWKDIQVLQFLPGTFLAYTGNAGRAKSKGVELSVESRPLKGLTITAWVVWNDSVLTEAFPPGSLSYGAPGNRLPYSSRLSGNFSLDQEFPLANSVRGFVGGSVSYVGDRLGLFTTTPERQDLPAYARTDVRAGVRYDSWTANFFVTNLADKRGVLLGGLGTTFPFAFYNIQPRTVGLSLAKNF